MFAIGIIVSVCYDDMVGHVYPHGVACLQYLLCQFVVVAAGSDIAAGMIMNQGDDCSFCLKSFLEYHPYVNGCLGQSALGEFYA